jgi:predicted MFS family arabinose efflux permease
MLSISELRERLTIPAAYATAAMPLNLTPLLIGALVTYLGLSEAEAGTVMTLELAAMALVAFALAPLGERLARGPTALIGCLTIIIATLVTTQVSGTVIVGSSRMAAGAGAGLLLLVANVLIAHSDDPVRRYGFAVLLTGFTGMLFLAVIPSTATAFGLSGAYGPLILLAVVAAPFALRARLATKSDEHTPHRSAAAPAQTAIWLAGAAIFATQLCQAAFFAFIERRGDDLGLAPTYIGMALSIAYGGTLLTTGLATWMGARWGLMGPIFVGLAGHLAGATAVLLTDSTAIYSLALVGQSAFYVFSIPFQLSIGSYLDPTGRFASAAAALFFFGLALGPALGGFLVGGFGYGVLAMTIIIGTVTAGIAYVAAINRRTTDGRLAQVA